MGETKSGIEVFPKISIAQVEKIPIKVIDDKKPPAANIS